MAELLFEIGVEELPSGYIDDALNFLRDRVSKDFLEAKLTFDKVEVAGTPRRLAVMVHGLLDKQPDVRGEVTGPKAEIAFEKDGSLSKAGLGFVQGKGIAPEKAYKKETPKGEVIAAIVEEKGKHARDIVGPMLEKAMRAIPFPKVMRWEHSSDVFARPVAWLLCILDGNVVPVKFANRTSSNKTCGHRYLAPDFKEILNIDAYQSFLKKSYVMLTKEERKSAIVEHSQKLAHTVHGQIVHDDELLERVANLVEYPWPVMGRFDDRFLVMTKELLISEMREHQQYFSVEDESGKLKPYFIVVSASKPVNEATLAAGNARVLKARFEDGAFYFGEDIKTSLSSRVPLLEGVTFQKELGTLASKVARIEALSQILCAMLQMPDDVRNAVAQTAQLCKADLVSGVVGEFPDLQGIMGREYALREGFSKQVADGIEQHYWPKGSGAVLAQGPEGAIVGLADRLDSLVGLIGVGKMPKGNADPFGLRRAAIAIVRIIAENGYRVSIKEVLEQTKDNFKNVKAFKPENVVAEALDFIIGRARGTFREMLDAGDEATLLIDGVMAAGSDDLTDAFARMQALHQVRAENVQTFDELVATFKRAGNIVAKARMDGAEIAFDVDSSVLKEKSEKELIVAVRDVQEELLASRSSSSDLTEHYVTVLKSIASLKPRVDKFFDEVMVMCEEMNLRAARLGLLAGLERIALALADFTKMQGVK